MAHFSRRSFLAASAAAAAPAPPPDKVAVLTFDDAVKSHRAFVAPLLKELGFGATFFVSHGFMNIVEHSLTWQEIAEIHQMGFEIGNHTWTHAGFHTPRAAARLEGELALVENELARVKVPRPTSFAWCGNTFGPEAVEVLRAKGFRFARRGEMPEAPYGQLVVGAAYDPRRHHPLLIPTTGDAYPSWNLDHFKKVVREARDGRIVILQFHGVPDIAHPWVHTPPERFREYMQYLKSEGFRVIALRDLDQFADLANPPADPLLYVRQPEPKGARGVRRAGVSRRHPSVDRNPGLEGSGAPHRPRRREPRQVDPKGSGGAPRSRAEPRAQPLLLSAIFRIFPEPVLGSASTNSTTRGSLNFARRSRQKSISSSAEALCPGFRATTAFGTSPHFSSGSAMTAHSRTAG